MLIINILNAWLERIDTHIRYIKCLIVKDHAHNQYIQRVFTLAETGVEVGREFRSNESPSQWVPVSLAWHHMESPWHGVVKYFTYKGFDTWVSSCDLGFLIQYVTSPDMYPICIPCILSQISLVPDPRFASPSLLIHRFANWECTGFLRPYTEYPCIRLYSHNS